MSRSLYINFVKENLLVALSFPLAFKNADGKGVTTLIVVELSKWKEGWKREFLQGFR